MGILQYTASLNWHLDSFSTLLNCLAARSMPNCQEQWAVGLLQYTAPLHGALGRGNHSVHYLTEGARGVSNSYVHCLTVVGDGHLDSFNTLPHCMGH